MSSRYAGRSLTLLLIFFITVVGVVIIFAYFAGVLHLMPSGQKQVDISAVFSIAGGGGPSATIALTVTNLSSTSLVGATFTCPATQFTDTTCGGLTLKLDGVPISSQNPAGQKATASGASSVAAIPGTTFTYGTTYTMTVTYTFSDGTTQSAAVPMPAQA
jgi:hypothetical protein